MSCLPLRQLFSFARARFSMRDTYERDMPSFLPTSRCGMAMPFAKPYRISITIRSRSSKMLCAALRTARHAELLIAVSATGFSALAITSASVISLPSLSVPSGSSKETSLFFLFRTNGHKYLVFNASCCKGGQCPTLVCVKASDCFYESDSPDGDKIIRITAACRVLFAICATSRRLCSMSLSRASSSPAASFFNSACSSSGVKAGGKLLFVVTMPTNTNIFLNICAMNSNIASVPFRIFRVYRQHCLRAFAISTSITSSPIF